MSKFSNVVRFKVKEGAVENFERHFQDREPFAGMLSQMLITTGDRSFCAVGVWESERAIAAARPQMIEFLDTLRGLLEELSPELGVTDPVSGPVVAEM